MVFSSWQRRSLNFFFACSAVLVGGDVVCYIVGQQSIRKYVGGHGRGQNRPWPILDRELVRPDYNERSWSRGTLFPYLDYFFVYRDILCFQMIFFWSVPGICRNYYFWYHIARYVPFFGFFIALLAHYCLLASLCPVSFFIRECPLSCTSRSVQSWGRALLCGRFYCSCGRE